MQVSCSIDKITLYMMDVINCVCDPIVYIDMHFTMLVSCHQIAQHHVCKLQLNNMHINVHVQQQ